MSGENYIEMSLEQLDSIGKDLSQAIREGYLNPERKIQVQYILGQVSFELWQRHQNEELVIINTMGV